MDTFGRFRFTAFDKGDDFCDFVFALVHTKPRLFRYKDFAPLGTEIISFTSRPIYRKHTKTIFTDVAPVKVYHLLLNAFHISFYNGR